MFIKGYLNEIKNRIILILLFYSFFFMFLYKYKNILIKLTILIDKGMAYKIFDYFIYTSITELFSTYISFNFFICNLVLYFQLTYHVICFLSCGLYLKEYCCLKLFFITSGSFGILSLFFAHILMLPLLLNFFLSFQLHNNFYFEAKIYEYLDFYKKVYFNTFINFQIIALLLTLLSLVQNSYKQTIFIKNRRQTYFICLTFATIVTPPDILSQLIIWIILIIFIEIIIFSLLMEKIYLSWQIIKTD